MFLIDSFKKQPDTPLKNFLSPGRKQQIRLIPCLIPKSVHSTHERQSNSMVFQGPAAKTTVQILTENNAPVNCGTHFLFQSVDPTHGIVMGKTVTEKTALALLVLSPSLPTRQDVCDAVLSSVPGHHCRSWPVVCYIDFTAQLVGFS